MSCQRGIAIERLTRDIADEEDDFRAHAAVVHGPVDDFGTLEPEVARAPRFVEAGLEMLDNCTAESGFERLRNVGGRHASGEPAGNGEPNLPITAA